MHAQADGLKQAAECDELRTRLDPLLSELSDTTTTLHAAYEELRVVEATALEWRHAAQRYAGHLQA